MKSFVNVSQQTVDHRPGIPRGPGNPFAPSAPGTPPSPLTPGKPGRPGRPGSPTIPGSPTWRTNFGSLVQNITWTCGISGFHCGMNEIVCLLGCYTAQTGSWSPMFQDNLLLPSSSVNPEELRSHIHCGGSMKWCNDNPDLRFLYCAAVGHVAHISEKLAATIFMVTLS